MPANAGFLRLANSVTRPAKARPRWILIIRLMYAASSALAGLLDLGADRVELASELLDVLLAEVGVLLDVGDGHAVVSLSAVEIRC